MGGLTSGEVVRIGPPHGQDRAMAALAPAAVLAVRRLARLVVPLQCPGCGTPDLPWCSPCRSALDGGLLRREHDAPRLDRLDGILPLPVWSSSAYEGPVRGIVLAWKDHGRLDLDPVVGGCLHAAGVRLAETIAVAASGTVTVIPAPSTRAATRTRGRHVVAGLALAFAAGLVEAGCPARVELALSRRRGGDQVGRGQRDRGARLAGVGLRRRALMAGRVCVLVDDVLTTGATLAACEGTLVAAGAHVLAAVVLAATPPPAATAGYESCTLQLPKVREPG